MRCVVPEEKPPLELRLLACPERRRRGHRPYRLPVVDRLYLGHPSELWPRRLVLLLGFAIMMTLALGVKSQLALSVFSASAGAFLLAAVSRR